MSETSNSGNFLLGCGVALASGTIVVPLQTMNLRMQLGMDESLQDSLEQGRELYKGYLWRCGRYVPRKLAIILTEDRIQSIVKNVPGFGKSIMGNIINSIITMALARPIDTQIIRLVRDMDDGNKVEFESHKIIRDEPLSAEKWSLVRMYAGALPEFGKILVSHAMYFLLFTAVDNLLPSKITKKQEIVLRGLLYLGADAASYPLGSVSRMQVAEDMTVQDAVMKCSAEGLFYKGYTFNVAITLAMVAFSVAMTRFSTELIRTGKKRMK